MNFAEFLEKTFLQNTSGAASEEIKSGVKRINNSFLNQHSHKPTYQGLTKQSQLLSSELIECCIKFV